MVPGIRLGEFLNSRRTVKRFSLAIGAGVLAAILGLAAAWWDTRGQKRKGRSAMTLERAIAKGRQLLLEVVERELENFSIMLLDHGADAETVAVAVEDQRFIMVANIEQQLATFEAEVRLVDFKRIGVSVH